MTVLITPFGSAHDPASAADEILSAALADERSVDLTGLNSPSLRSMRRLPEDVVRFIGRLIHHLEPQHIIEFGASSATLLALQMNQERTSPFSHSVIEHAPGFAREQDLQPLAPGQRFTCSAAPLVVSSDAFREAVNRADAITLATPEPADLIVIAGPPAALGGRTGILGQALAFARPGTIVLFPGSRHGAGPRTLDRWRERFSASVTVRELPGFTQGMAALLVNQIPATSREAGTSVATLVPHVRAAAQRIRPSLAVLGDHRHFQGSELAPIASTYLDVHEVRDIDTMPSPTDDRPIAWLKWAPWSTYDTPSSIRERLPAGTRVINDTHFRCEKSNVEHHFALVAGYPLRLDPARHQGPALRKSERNAAHDGTIVQLPITNPDPRMVYQRLVNSFAGEIGQVRYFCDIRVPIVLGQIPCVSVKLVPEERRFGVRVGRAAVHQEIFAPADILNDAEVRLIIDFCASIGLEFGALDVLRDADDGRIYIIDANNTPHPANGNLSQREIELRKGLIGQAVLSRFYADTMK